MAEHVTGFNTAEGVKKYDFNALANRPTDATNTVISPNADYAEVGEWADGNPSAENRLGYFVAVAEVADNTTKIRKATSKDDVRGVTVYNPAFSGNAAANKYGASGELLKQYNYVGIMGIIPVIDNGRCTVQGRCMPADDGTAIPSTNNMGYAVLERVDATHVLIAVEPGADMAQRIKSDIRDIETQIERLAATPYDKATDGEKLYDVNFGSSNFVSVDDNGDPYNDGGVLETYQDGEYGPGSYPPNQWHKSISTEANIGTERALTISGADVTGEDYRAIGYLPMFDLENKTYTVDLEYFRNFDYRHKFYFATGNFLTEDGQPMLGVPEKNATTEPTHPCLALELNKSGDYVDYKFYRQSTGFTNDTNLFNRKTIKFEKNSTGEFVAKIKMVVRGGARVYDTIYQHWGLSHNAPSNTEQPRWTGYLIPLNITIYHNDTKVSEVLVYQPIGTGLVLGVGNWDKPATNEYCGIRNVSIYKGDITKPRESSVRVDLSAYDTDGKIVETYADGSTKTSTIEFDENGNPIKITDSNGHVTEITW